MLSAQAIACCIWLHCSSHLQRQSGRTFPTKRGGLWSEVDNASWQRFLHGVLLRKDGDPNILNYSKHQCKNHLTRWTRIFVIERISGPASQSHRLDQQQRNRSCSNFQPQTNRSSSRSNSRDPFPFTKDQDYARTLRVIENKSKLLDAELY